MKLTSDLFADFLKCLTKCYLHSKGEAGSRTAYTEWVREQNDTYRAEAAKRLMLGVPEAEVGIAPPAAEDLKAAKWLLAIDLPIQAGDMESRLNAVERVPSQGRGRAAQFTPIRFTFFNKLTKDDRLLVAFDALLLSEMLGREVSMGKIVHGDECATLKVKVASLLGSTRVLIGKMSALLAGGSPPDLILNRHCVECEFRDGCRQRALEKDDLSLLSNMTEKERKTFNNEGIFTLNQLSFTFRPRRRPQRLRDKREKYHHALKALAIREKKIHIVGTPELKIDGTPVYLDVEGLPDRDFYYLIGMRVKTADSEDEHSFWANDIAAERKVWQNFLAVLSEIEKPLLLHYGSFETTFFRKMFERHGEPPQGSVAAKAIKSAINLLSFLFAQVYFPTFSNGLKDVGAWIGSEWSSNNLSGAQSTAWRMKWEQSSDASLKKDLIRYNLDDCRALEAVTQVLKRLCDPAHRSVLEGGADPNAVLAKSSSSKSTLWPRFSSAIDGFDAINEAARWDVQREKVYVRTDKLLRRCHSKGKRGQKRVMRLNRRIEYSREAVCAECGKKPSFRGFRTKVIYDVRFSRFGIRRWVVAYRFAVYWCNRCGFMLGTPKQFQPWGVYGRNLVMFLVYQTVDLCMPQHAVAQELNRLFGLGIPQGVVHRLKATAAEHYRDTRTRILQRLVKGNLLHADETPMVLKHKRGYVWVFASFHEVVYFFTETREGNFVQETLKEFKGVLISDFYAPYDSLSCPQQKCLIHLIRDLNDAVMDHPYDSELKGIVTGFADLLRAIVETIDKWGLKRHFLRKHLKDVDRFYRTRISIDHRSEAASKWKDRFLKNRNGLFTFLNYDGVPWNNNNAEHAIKAFAQLRRAIVGLSTAKGIEEYLILLSICQTCKYSGLDFLDLLLSGEKDIDAFTARHGRHARRHKRDVKLI